MVGRIAAPARATTSRSASGRQVAVDDPVHARLGGAARRGGAARVNGDAGPRRCASSTTAATSSRARVWRSPERLSAILTKFTPCLHCRRTSVTISAALLHSTPTEWSGVPTQAGSSSRCCRK